MKQRNRIWNVVSNSLIPVSKGEISRTLPDVSPTLVEAVPGKMVKSGKTRKAGTGRNPKYLAIAEGSGK